MFTIVMLIVILILSIIFIKIKKDTKPYPPGPFSWPFIGNQFLLKRLTREFGGQHKAFLELSRRYNSDIITVNISHEKIIIVSGSKFCDLILQNEEFQGRPWNEFIKIRNMGKKQGITMNDGAEWKELRNWMMRTMKIFGFGKSEMIKMIQNQLIIFSENLNKNKLHRLKLLFVPAVINVLWNFTTGELTAFDQQQKLEYFLDLLERRSKCFDITGGLLSAFPWIRYIAPEISGYNIMCMLNNELKDFLMKIITDHKEKYSLGKEADLIDMFLQEMKKNEESTIFTDEQLMMILIDLFLAGFTTTSTSLDFLFLIMTLFPDVQRKVQKEIDSVIPRDRLPNMEDKAKLPYVEAVINETYRLWPVFPIIGPRRVLCDTNIDKYMIPKNTTVLFNTYSINKDPTLYPEPDKFMPERFIKNGVFIPDEYSLQFGKGKRRCPGDVLAKATIFILFVGIMQKHTLLPVPGKGPYSIEINSGITLTPQPYDVLVEKR